MKYIQEWVWTFYLGGSLAWAGCSWFEILVIVVPTCALIEWAFSDNTALEPTNTTEPKLNTE